MSSINLFMPHCSIINTIMIGSIVLAIVNAIHVDDKLIPFQHILTLLQAIKYIDKVDVSYISLFIPHCLPSTRKW